MIGLGLGLLGSFGFWLLGWRWFWAWWTSFSIVAFAAYGADKWQARRGGQRIPELVLHALAVSGGIAGAWIGRSLFRHKTRHAVFTAVLLLSTALHLALWYFVVWKE